MKPPDATLASGRFELRAAARGIPVLADPPEAGWRVRMASDEQQSKSDAEKVSAPENQRDRARAGLLEVGAQE